MRPFPPALAARALAAGLASAVLLILAAAPAVSDDAPAPGDSPMVKMLKGGRVPPERQGTLVDMLGKRGTPADLDYLLGRALAPDGFAPAVRASALAALAEAALTRKARPAGDLDRVGALLGADADAPPAVRRAAVRLAGLWGLASQVDALAALASSDGDPESAGAAAEALAAVGGDAARARLEALAGPGRPVPVRARSAAALSALDPTAAAARAASLLRDAGPADDLAPLMAAFLNRQGGGEALAAALAAEALPADAAKLGLRAVYAVGRTEPALVAELSKQAGISADVAPPTSAEVEALLAEVAANGDPARGERVFRRAELNCLKCHAVSGAGGDVGPDLSAVGASSPVDFLVRSVMVPDEAIKEAFQTLVVQTEDGQVLQGIVADRDDRRIVLKESTGDLRVIPVDAVEDSKEGGSLMPKGLVNFMTRAEFVDLVRFLSELGKPGPYAVRTGQTIQRWGVLRPVPDDLSVGVPDPETFRTNVLAAEPGRWAPAYGMVGGALPLDEARAEAGGSPVLYLRGEVAVTVAGPVAFKLDDPSGVSAWVDDRPVDVAASEPVALEPGRHALTLRVDTAARPSGEVRVEAVRPAGASTEFVAVGGR